MERAITMSVEDTARIIRKNPQNVRLGLQQGVFPFGVAIRKPDGRFTYNIIAKKVYEYAGINNGGITNENT